MNIPPQIQAEIEQAATATPGDVLRARAAILGVLAQEQSCHVSAFEAAVCSEFDVPSGQDQREGVDLARVDDRWMLPSTDHPVLMRARAQDAVAEALSLLVVDGVVTQAVGSRYGPTTRSVGVSMMLSGSGSRGSHSWAHHAPTQGANPAECRWRLVRPVDHSRTKVAGQHLPDGLEEILGERGGEVLAEAVACVHRARYLAAADLLAAASEAAWFALAAALVGRDSVLDRHVSAGQNAADVIDRTAAILRQERLLERQVLGDLRAHAARLRDVRNYGLHPVGDRDVDREHAFTEEGCTVLFMGARRYFVALQGVLGAAAEDEASKADK